MIVDDDAVLDLEAAALEEFELGSTPTPTTARNASISCPETVRAPVSIRPFARNSSMLSPSNSSTPCSR